jgi:hypothetical protein
MRSMKLVALGALSLLSLVGCNQGQPRIYRVAIDETPMRTITTPVCFRNSAIPNGASSTTEQNYRTEEEWVIWNGVEQTEYLDIGKQTYTLGDAPTIDVSDIIEGSEKSFSALRNVQKANGDQYTEGRRTQIAVKFNDYSFAPTGTVSLSAEYACAKGRANCPQGVDAPDDAASCTAQLAFVARRIDVQQLTAYTNNP